MGFMGIEEAVFHFLKVRSLSLCIYEFDQRPFVYRVVYVYNAQTPSKFLRSFIREESRIYGLHIYVIRATRVN